MYHHPKHMEYGLGQPPKKENNVRNESLQVFYIFTDKLMIINMYKYT